MVAVCHIAGVQATQAAEPRIVDAVVTGGHDGAPELVLKLRYENGVVGDVLMENDLGAQLIARCGGELQKLVGQSWREALAVAQRANR